MAGKGTIMVLPTKVLENALNREILLVLKDSRVLEGKLVGFDEYMNLVLEDTEETREEQVRRLGTVVLRGNNVVTISPK
jgi:small nuclear ribonucleoprotein